MAVTSPSSRSPRRDGGCGSRPVRSAGACGGRRGPMARHRCPGACSSTGTARSSSTFPTTAIPPRWSPVAGAPRALDRLAPSGLPVGIITNQSGVGRRAARPSTGRRGQRTGRRSARAVRRRRGLPARPGPTGAAAASRRPGMVLDAAASARRRTEPRAPWSATSAPTSRPRSPPGARAILVPTAVTATGGDRRRRPRSRQRPRRRRGRPARSASGRRRVGRDAVGWSPGSTTSATSCSPGRPSGRWPRPAIR